MSSKRYPTDLSDAEWSLLEPHLPVPKRRGRPRVHSPREILNAVFYVLKSGCQWRMLPRELPPWKTEFHYFRTWRIDGTWERMNRAMRDALAEAFGASGERHEALLAAIALALDFQTWHTLVRQQELNQDRAVGLMIGMVRCLMST